jgi:hypothetical protein
MKNTQKHTPRNLTKRFLGTAVAVTALILPAIASAQDVPPYAVGAQQQIAGTVAAINGTWNITVADANGYDDSVELRQGTIINPTGLTLEPGMSVTVDGYADGSNFDATEIDTPYAYEGPPPAAVYYGPGAWYPGYAYGWGPSFTLDFNLGSRSFEQRSFSYNGAVRRPQAPPAGWQNQPHGFVGHAAIHGSVSFAAPARTFAAPPQQRSFAPQQQTRNFAPAPQQQRTFAARPQQQTRGFAAPAARPAAPAPHGTPGGDRHR